MWSARRLRNPFRRSSNVSTRNHRSTQRAGRPTRTRTPSRARTQLALEDLEPRTLLAATQFGVFPSVQSLLAGAPFGLTVTAEDATGHPAAYLGPVHFSSSDPQATLPADYTLTAADHGTHTFSGVVFRTSGSQTLTASNGGVGSVTEFSIPTGSSPVGVTAGPDGNLWFTELYGNKVGKITPAGAVTEFPNPTSGSSPSEITAGPDGNLWFADYYGNKVGKITTAGAVTTYTIPTGGSSPFGITAGPDDGNLWFT